MHPITLEDHHVTILRKAADGLKHPYPVAFALMLEAGLRVAEVTQLAWLDLLHLGTVKSALAITAAMTKGSRTRTLPINQALHNAIRDAWHRSDAAGPPRCTDYVVAVKSGTPPVSTRSIERNLAKLSEHALGMHVNPHMLRHTFASRLLRVSNLEIVRAALGHARVSTTQIYAHTSIDDLAEAMRKVN